jgi:hypothetical protein
MYKKAKTSALFRFILQYERIAICSSYSATKKQVRSALPRNVNLKRTTIIVVYQNKNAREVELGTTIKFLKKLAYGTQKESSVGREPTKPKFLAVNRENCDNDFASECREQFNLSFSEPSNGSTSNPIGSIGRRGVAQVRRSARFSAHARAFYAAPTKEEANEIAVLTLTQMRALYPGRLRLADIKRMFAEVHDG